MMIMNKKKVALITIWVSLFVLFTSLVFFVIGANSNMLVSSLGKSFAFSIFVLSIIFLITGIVLLIKNWQLEIFKKFKIWLFSILVGLYIIGCSSFLFILYGPYKGFREWLITTAMATMNHQYYCKWFYNEDAINEVLSQNFVDDSGMETDPGLVDHKPITTSKDDYEKEILDHEEGALYKVIRFKLRDQEAYLAVIYDPSKISVGISRKIFKSGQYVYTMAKEQNAVVAINGGGFQDPGHNSSGGFPIGVTISNGKIITDYSYSRAHGLIGFNKDNTLILMKNTSAEEAINAGVRDAVTMAPFLIVNGQRVKMSGNGGWGVAARTAIGQRKDGIVLMLVVDSNATRTKGASMVDLADIMERYGAVNAANLDGGTSSVMAINGEMINDPIDSALRHKTRGLPTTFLVKE